MKKVGVVVATYNGDKYIIEELRSILEQTKLVDKVVISDDHSSDNTVILVKKFIQTNNLNNWTLIEHESNNGFSENFMHALYNFDCDYIFLADQDDIWESDKVEKMCKVLQDNPDVLAVASDFSFINGCGVFIDAPKGVPNAKCKLDGSVQCEPVAQMFMSSYIRGCTMLINKQVANYSQKYELDKYCSNSNLGHDWLLWTLAGLMGKCMILHKSLIRYRIHESNTSLTALHRKELTGDIRVRINALEKSIAIHQFFLHHKDDYNNFGDKEVLLCKKCISFEKRRLRLLTESHFHLFLYMRLGGDLKYYDRYYHKRLSGIKVYVGDLLYYLANKIRQ